MKKIIFAIFLLFVLCNFSIAKLSHIGKEADFTNITTNIIQTENNTITRISSTVVMGYQIVKGSFSVIGNANITGWTVFNGSVTILTNGVIPLSLRNAAGSGKLINLWRAGEYAGSIDVIDGPYNGIDITGGSGYGINFRPAANTLIRYTRDGDDTVVSTLTVNTGDMDFYGTCSASTLTVKNSFRLPLTTEVQAGTGIYVTATIPTGYALTPSFYTIMVGTDTIIVPGFKKQ